MAATIAASAPASSAPKPWYKVLYIQVLIAIALGIPVGVLAGPRPRVDQAAGRRLHQADQDGHRPGHLLHRRRRHRPYQRPGEVGRVGVKALVYFEVVSTFALMIGLVVGNVVRPGVGINIDPPRSTPQRSPASPSRREALKPPILLHIIPDTVVGAFAGGEILQVLFFAILFGFASWRLGERGHTVAIFVEDAAHGVFGVIPIVVRVAPIGAFGAMAYTIGKYGTRRDRQPDRADPDLLPHLAAVRVGGARGDRALAGFSIFKFLAISGRSC